MGVGSSNRKNQWQVGWWGLGGRFGAGLAWQEPTVERDEPDGCLATATGPEAACPGRCLATIGLGKGRANHMQVPPHCANRHLPVPSGTQARILVHGKVTHLGYYETEEEAARVYDK